MYNECNSFLWGGYGLRLRTVPCEREIHTGEGAGGTLLLGELTAQQEALRVGFGGQVQTIYLDPPFNTGKSYVLRMRVGETGWVKGTPSVSLPAYSDRWPDDEAYLSMLREAILLAHDLLREDGSFFLHIDARMHAQVRLLADEIFGVKNFVNEIVWVYQSGGRSMSHFSRKHDIILFYRKSPGAYFNIQAIGVPRARARSNHMRRGVDESGRAYRSIVSQGKEYRYYDDEPVFPSDVWDDVSHMQQKDPQRTGFENQKPLRLLERVLLCSSTPGDLVCDLFGGSGTTAVAAARHGRRFLLMDASGPSLIVSRKRLLGNAMSLEAPTDTGAPVLRGEVARGLGMLQIRLTDYRLEEGLTNLSLGSLDAVDQVSAGYLRDGVFHAFANAARWRGEPELPETLELPVLDGEPALMTVDILGRRLLHVMEDLDDGNE